ncbi:hypothetical protein NVP1088O_36 [Vibrio phage 1.088.O._10N.261.46.A1]|nr:hypothetical protein NVP1088O_36 [Vibrio phage 1.088.O._10N.261.46.A1]
MIYVVVYFDGGDWINVHSHHETSDAAINARNSLRRGASRHEDYEVVVIEEREKYADDYELNPNSN